MMRAELMKNLLLEIEACLRDPGRYFSVKDLKTEDYSRTSVYRWVKSLREINVIEKIGRSKYSVSEQFKKELLREIRK